MKIISVNRGLRSEFKSDLRSDEHYWSSYFKWLEVRKKYSIDSIHPVYISVNFNNNIHV